MSADVVILHINPARMGGVYFISSKDCILYSVGYRPVIKEIGGFV